MKLRNVLALMGLLLFSNFLWSQALNDDHLDSQKSYLGAEIISKPGFVGDTICYNVQVKNISDVAQTFRLNVDNIRELACETSLSLSEISLKSGEEQSAKLQVVMNDRIPLGGFENCLLIAKDGNGQALDELKYSSTNAKSHPFLLATDGLMEEVKEKIKNYDWAKNNFNSMLEELADFQFPKQKIVTKPRPTKVWSSLNYVASDGEQAFKLAIAYKLTGDVKYFDKLIAFIKKLTDPNEGYLSVGAATTGVMVHEGNFFLHLAAACDLVYAELDDDDKDNIEVIFRHYLKQNRTHMNSLGIMNHQASANAGAILVAIYLQDVAEVEHLTFADGGMADQISKGVMADGWWFEGTVNYCYLVTQRYCLVAQAFENYGWDLYHRRFPVKYKSKDFDNAKEGFTGMKFDNWGPTGKSTRGLEDMVGCYVDFMDYNAVVVSSNDSRATKPDPYYELAYREFGGDELAWVLSKTERKSWISLLYGLAELPQGTDPRTKSALAPNVGITALRSQKAQVQAKDQIEAYLKFGTHGGWHGQFDRTGLLALNRNDHKYFGTEMAWFGYGHAGYKECVQTSATHNMVMVDELQQEAVPSEQLLFYAGNKMQVSVTQTVARWRKIPTFNIEKFPPWNDKEFDPDFEPVLQRRLSIVTDDYVVLADYMKAPQKHSYDWLLHPIGFKNIEGATKTGGVLDTVNTHFESPYKYFTKGQWYKTKDGSKLEFDEDGNKLDVYNLWPKKKEVLVANYPNGGKGDEIKNNPGRRTVALRVNEKEVVYLVVLEPYQGASSIEKIESKSVEKLTIRLSDGRTQTISISNLKGDGSDIKVRLEEQAGNSTTIEESSDSPENSLEHDKVFNEYKAHEFLFDGNVARIVFPEKANKNRDWIWRARFWGHEPQVDKALLEKGFHVVYVDVADLFGSPEAVERWNKFYDSCISEYHLNKKVALEGMSRGGLIIYNWASQNTDKVSCIYADAPVCDIKSWPGGMYSGSGSPLAWKSCLQAYGLHKDSIMTFKGIPINTCVNVAKAGIPVLHVYGDADKVVPFDENTALLSAQFQKAGGKIELIKKEGVGHHPHCLKDPKPIVEFILNNTD